MLKKTISLCLLASLPVYFTSCAATKVEEHEVQMPEDISPQAKMTNYSEALRELGMMSEIYATGELRIQSNPIGDNTGTSGSTGGEIPRDITEMIKSALNSVGGNIVYIPYDPAFIQNQMVTGYSDFQQKLVPEVVITGGITEFDRGLKTTEDGTDAGASVDVVGATAASALKSAGLGTSIGANYENIEKSGLSRITLDFNLIDFRTMSGVPRMNTVNTIEVHKVMKDKSLGVGIFGLSFGSKGSVKKVQGRHHAVRTLVEISMMQMIGRYLGLPYWRLIGEDALPDEVVKQNFIKNFYKWPEQTKIAGVQEWLYIHGHDVYVTGELDARTKAALTKIEPVSGGNVSAEIAWKIYSTMPLSNEAYSKRMLLASGKVSQPFQTTTTEIKEIKKQQKIPTSTKKEEPVAEKLKPEPIKEDVKQQQAKQEIRQEVKQEAKQQTKKEVQAEPQSEKRTIIKSKTAIGRIIDESEW